MAKAVLNAEQERLLLKQRMERKVRVEEERNRRLGELKARMPMPVAVKWNGDNIVGQEMVAEENNGLDIPKHLIFLRKSRAGSEGEILDTVGIELESVALTQKAAKLVVMELPYGLSNYYKVHRDGSTEMKTYNISIDGTRRNRFLNLNCHTDEASLLFKSRPTETSGYELISVPMSIKVADLSLRALLPRLKSAGDFISERCATHIHVGMGKSLPFMKNLLKLGLWGDDLFYSLAGMGTKFRGYSNNAIYARPLANGPFFSVGNGVYYQTLNWKKALEAESLYDFFACYGVDIYGEIPKYTPARYFSLNLYSTFLHGTVEFRYFNQSFDAPLVSAVTKLCQLFVEIGMKIRKEFIAPLKPCNVFETQSPTYYLEKLHNILDIGRLLECKYKLDAQDISKLEEVIYSYEGIGVKDLSIMTHLNNPNVSRKAVIDGDLLSTSKTPLPDGHVDIHNIKTVSIMKETGE